MTQDEPQETYGICFDKERTLWFKGFDRDGTPCWSRKDRAQVFTDRTMAEMQAYLLVKYCAADIQLALAPTQSEITALEEQDAAEMWRDIGDAWA